MRGILRSYPGKFIFVFIIVLVSVKAGLLLVEPPYYTAIIWPAFGIATGFLMLYGIRYMPAVLLALFTGFYFHDYTAIELLITPLKIAVILSLLGSVIILAKHLFLSRMLKNDSSIAEPIIFTRLFLILATISIILCVVPVLFNFGTFIVAKSTAQYITLSWISSDLVGSIIFIPLFISFKTKKPADREGGYLEKISLAVLLISFILLILLINKNHLLKVSYLLIPFFFWIAFRFNYRDAAVSLVILSILSTYVVMYQSDDLAGKEYFHSVYFYHMYLFISVVVYFMINAFSVRRKMINEVLQQEINRLSSGKKEESIDL